MTKPHRNESSVGGFDRLELMDGGLAEAARVPADVRIAGRGQDFDLPLWIDPEGDLRLALPKVNPQHAGDVDQVIFDLAEFVKALGYAIEQRAA